MWALLLGLALALQLVAPAYYVWMRRRARRLDPVHVAPGASYPPVTVILATYNEESTVRGRLENLRGHDYPALDVIVVDSASTDKTREIVRAFAAEHAEFPIRLVEEPERRGKVRALRDVMPLVKSDLVCITDADCLWEAGALRAAVTRIGDARVGAVTGVQVLLEGDGLAQEMEKGYNAFYNALRQGESSLDSTPVFRGELALIRRELLDGMALGDERHYRPHCTCG